MTGPASQSLGPDKASWAKLLFLSAVDQQVCCTREISSLYNNWYQDQMSLKRFTALVQHFGAGLTEEGAT